MMSTRVRISRSHFGYFVYAAAVIAKAEPTYFSGQRLAALLSLIRDFANPSGADPYFTPTRMKSWFDGHSWASGLFIFGAGYARVAIRARGVIAEGGVLRSCLFVCAERIRRAHRRP
jgi:hypothetical protein